MLAALLFSGCAEQQATSDPINKTQSCPTAGTLVQPSMNDWRVDYNDYLNARITFSPGDKCSLEELAAVANQQFIYEIVVNDQTYQNYMVAAVTLDEGKTIKDLEDYSKTMIGVVPPPSFSKLQLMEIVPPMSRTLHAVPMPVSPIYLVCIVQGPSEQQGIQVLGPVTIVQ